MFTLVENALVYAPAPLGRKSVLAVNGVIARIGDVDRRGLDALGVEYEVIDATGCVLTPGIVDPHEHLLGGSGEKGFSSQTPEFFLSEIVRWGITTVVGTLGVDTTMKTLPGLLAKVKGLREEGLSAYMWTGGYNVPPTTVMSSVRDDVLFIDEVIGSGEVAISDVRATDPDPRELAKLVHDTYVGGMLSQKAGVTHFHVGEGPRRLQCLRDLLNEKVFQVEASWLYPTHVSRSEELMLEAIELTRAGANVDIDVVQEDFSRWLRFYLDHGGDPACFTASSDASITSPRTLYEQMCKAVVEHKFTLEQVLPHFTSNAARILKLKAKGEIEVGRDADLLIMREGTLDVVHVLARGKVMVRDGGVCVEELFVEESNRRISIDGGKR
jgi:beta-aspartyl-dipeptidase (metallo-type)